MRSKPYLRQISASLTFVLTFSILAIAQAEKAVSPALLKALKDLDEATQIGLTTIGGESIESLKKKLGDINVVYTNRVRFQSPEDARLGTYRATAEYDKSTNTIFVSRDHAERYASRSDDGRRENSESGTMVHEGIQILGIDDSNFTKSALLSTILTLKSIDERKRQKGETSFFKTPNSLQIYIDQLAKKGGTSGVGGGGDGRLFQFTELFLLEFFYYVDRGMVAPEVFGKVVEQFEKLDLKFSRAVPQGKLLFDSKKMILIVPPNVATENNINLNYDEVRRFTIELIETTKL